MNFKEKVFLSWKKYFLFFCCVSNYSVWMRQRTVGVGGGGPPTNAYFRANLKVSVFKNGHFSRHLIFYQKTFWGKKNFFTPKKHFVFLRKKHFSFFGKTIFLGEIFFKKISKTFWQIFCGQKSFGNFQTNSSKKNFPKKHFFSKKRKTCLFSKKQSACLPG